MKRQSCSHRGSPIDFIPPQKEIQREPADSGSARKHPLQGVLVVR